jgi:hypothetical protein
MACSPTLQNIQHQPEGQFINLPRINGKLTGYGGLRQSIVAQRGEYLLQYDRLLMRNRFRLRDANALLRNLTTQRAADPI